MIKNVTIVSLSNNTTSTKTVQSCCTHAKKQIVTAQRIFAVMISTLDVVIGITAALAISVIAWKFRALSVSGALSATAVGASIYIFGGLEAAAILMVFFFSGSLLARLNLRESAPRNWKQVLCNGGAAVLGVVWLYFRPELREQATLFFLGSVAAVTADTWATEIGMRYGKNVYDIVSFRPAQRGLSGGVSGAGILASIVGASLIALLPEIVFYTDGKLCGLVLVNVFPVVAIAGVCGSLLDSIIGSRLQAKYRFADGSIRESSIEGNGERISGIRFIGNNATNLIASIWGGFIAAGLMHL